jgi:DNA modification methylase
MGDSYAGSGKGKGTHTFSRKQATNTASSRTPAMPTTENGIKPKNICGIPWRLALALQADGWNLRQDIIWNKPNPMPESVNDRCTRSHEYIFLFTKSNRYYWNAAAMREPAANGGKLRNRHSVWTVKPEPSGHANLPAFPAALIAPMILAGCPPRGVVLDPFIGSGTTALVAAQLGRRCIGIDVSPEYLALARKRLMQEVLRLS